MKEVRNEPNKKSVKKFQFLVLFVQIQNVYVGGSLLDTLDLLNCAVHKVYEAEITRRWGILVFYNRIASELISC